MAIELSRSSYLEKNVGSFDGSIEIMGRRYVKVDDLRYGTNPHQPAAYYRPVDVVPSPIGDMTVVKNGKSGLSQTNLEDVSGALNIVKFFDVPACAVMKHVNPSGAAAAVPGDTLRDVYLKARDAGARAAFGSGVAFNVELDVATAEEIMGTFVECVVAPSFAPGVAEVFLDAEKYKLNRHIRVLQCGALSGLPRYTGDASTVHNTIKVLADGSLIVAAPLTTSLRNAKDLVRASGENARCGKMVSTAGCTDRMLEDLLFSWYVNLGVRSNGVVIAKDGQTLSVGTGEQDRVGAIEQAVAKFSQKYKGAGTLDGAVMSSDGFFPFEDGVEVAAAAGIKAVVAPAGSLRDADVVKRANELGVALFHAPERIFSHH
ncbi:MAG: hypothetical protein MJ025_06030 [Victivallaceae bacterium]|nr:hypothetical protein [Victivallaceae bacterium]